MRGVKNMMGTQVKGLARAWGVLVFYGIIAVLFGIFAIFTPLAAAMSLVWALGLMALVEGIVSVVALFQRNAAVSRGWLLLYAIASVVFGILAISNPLEVAGVLLMMLAIWLILAGIFRIVLAIRIRKSIQGEWLIALSGLFSLILGLLFVLSPLMGVVVTTLWIGVLAVFYGLVQILAGWRLRKLA